MLEFIMEFFEDTRKSIRLRKHYLTDNQRRAPRNTHLSHKGNALNSSKGIFPVAQYKTGYPDRAASHYEGLPIQQDPQQ